jgi:hypothetical protein
MRRLEMEGWVLKTIDGITKGSPHEDSRVECKAEWPENTKKAARQLGAHANAAGGEPILWIVGLDRTRGVLGAQDRELSNWWSSVKSEFNQLEPVLAADLIVPVGDKVVVALLFQTDRAPFVVKAQEGFLEVPWRQGTRTNSAQRSDLVRLLVPAVKLPDVESLSTALRMTELPDEGKFRLDASLNIYIVPKTELRVAFPFHHTRCSVQFGEFQTDFHRVDFALPEPSPPNPWEKKLSFAVIPPPPPPQSLTVKMAPTEMIVDGPGSFIIRAKHYFDSLPNLTDEATIFVEAKPAGSDLAAILVVTIHRRNRGEAVAKWGSELF